MRIIILFVATLLLLFPASAEKRAFIVGVSNYEHLTNLRKTEGDAAGYASLFGNQLGFKVTRIPANAKRRDFIASFDQFVRSISPGDEVVFVYSGHGWSDGSDNFLALSDAPSGVAEAVLRAESVALERFVMGRLRAQHPRLLFAIVDACRDEQYDSLTKSSGSLDKGLSRVSALDGELILYSAGAGQTSLDRLSNDDSSPYSVFSRVLIPRLSDTTRPLAVIADETRKEVQTLAGSVRHNQRPELMLGISLDYCLSGNCLDGRSGQESEEFARIIDCKSAKAFLAKYGNGRFSKQAQSLERAFCSPASISTPAPVQTRKLQSNFSVQSIRSDCPWNGKTFMAANTMIQVLPLQPRQKVAPG
jgi:uncharacterized caspase-like protein